MAIRRSAPRNPPPKDCPLEEALQVLASTWTPKILWFLSEGPRRFGDLRRDLESISPKVLTERLRDLERNEIITRKVLPTSPPTVEYSLTGLGREFGPVLDAMEKVARRIRRTK